MKKFLVALLLVSTCLFSISSADAAISDIQNPTLPFSYQGKTFTDVLVVANDYTGYNQWRYTYFFYNRNEVTKIYTGDNGQGWGTNFEFVSNSPNYYWYMLTAQSTSTNFPSSFSLNSYDNTYNAGHFMTQPFYGIYYPSAVSSHIISSQSVYDNTQGTVLMSANLIPPSQLTINIDPIEGGNVTDGGNIECNVSTSAVCQYPLSQVNQSSLQANANCDYAFGGWIGKENPHAVTPTADTTITAKFYKTFRTAAGGFKTAYVPNENTHGGQCLEYVEFETDLPNDVCTYSAINCLAQASIKGYATGKEPREGAIIAFSQSLTLPKGHVGIVASINESAGTISIHDSNWCDSDCEYVKEYDVNINSSNILGYIYHTP